MALHNCDILIVGGGPAGSSAAMAAACRGMNVLVVDRRSVIGLPVQCAEYIPALLLNELDLKPDFVVQKINGMRTFLPNGEKKYTRAPGFTIHRDRFDQQLAARAKDAGAKYLLSTSARRFDKGAVVLYKRKESREVISRPKVIIGADGPFSRVGAWINSVNRNRIPALQVQVPLNKPQADTEVYFNEDVFGGYGWLFPKGNVANVGLGCKKRVGRQNPIRVQLDRFVAYLIRQGKIGAKVLQRAAGWLPAEQPRAIRKDNIILSGDAAGHTHAITGAGIAQAVIGGKFAGKWASRSVKNNDPVMLSQYENEWLELYGRVLTKAYKRRTTLEREWHRFDAVIKNCWVAYREYHAKTKR